MIAGAGVTSKPPSLNVFGAWTGKTPDSGASRAAAPPASVALCSLHVIPPAQRLLGSQTSYRAADGSQRKFPKQTRRSCMVFSNLDLQVRQCLCHHTLFIRRSQKPTHFSRGRNVDFLMVRVSKHLQTCFKTPTPRVTI